MEQISQNLIPEPIQPTETELTEKQDKREARFEMIAGVIIAIFTAVLALSSLIGDTYGEGILIANGEKISAYDWYSAKSIKQILTEGQKDTLEALLVSGELKANTIDDIKTNLDKLDDLVGINQTEIKNFLEQINTEEAAKVQPTQINMNDESFWRTFGALEALLNSQELSVTSEDNLKQYVDQLETKIEKYNKEKNEILVGSDNLPKEDWAQDVDGELGKVVGAQEWEDEIDILNEAGSKLDLSGLFLEICLVMGAISLIMQRPGSKWIFLSINIILGLIGTSFLVWGVNIYWPF